MQQTNGIEATLLRSSQLPSDPLGPQQPLFDFTRTEAASAGGREHTFESVSLRVGEGSLEIVLEGENGTLGAYQAFIAPG